MCQIGTQIDSDSSLKELELQQEIPATAGVLMQEDVQNLENNPRCPICGDTYKKTAFASLHKHVMGHFTDSISNDFEMIT